MKKIPKYDIILAKTAARPCISIYSTPVVMEKLSFHHDGLKWQPRRAIFHIWVYPVSPGIHLVAGCSINQDNVDQKRFYNFHPS